MKAVVTVIGKDQKGIIAKTSGVLYENDVNILDISQTTMQDMFTMIMLVEYDGEKLTVYYAGFRDLTVEEQRVIDGWKEKSITPEFKARAEMDALTDGSSTYWEEVVYFNKSGYEYLMGMKEQRGMKYDYNRRQVRDAKIKGSMCMQYEIRRIASA